MAILDPWRSLVVMRPDRVTLAAFVGFVLIAGAVSVAIRLGSFELPPFWAATLRYAMAVPIFLAWRSRCTSRSRAARTSSAHW